MLTHLHRVELVTAWHLKVFRRELDLAIVVRALDDLESDVEVGVWEVPPYDLADVHARAEILARRHAAALGTRTLDILHVAAAVVTGARDFVTGDRRQASLAEAAELKVTRYRPRS
ncbi:MAG: type II toxin-antitoxin system VapC family toxin [Candidatus Binatia bacterium]